MALNPIDFTERVVGGFLRDQLTDYRLADNHLYSQGRTPLRDGAFIDLSRPTRDNGLPSEEYHEP